MSIRPAIRHFAPDEGGSFKVGRFDVSLVAGTRDGAGYTMAEVTVPPGLGASPHHHPYEESIYVLEGVFELCGADGARRRGDAGCAIHAPANAVHGFRNAGDTAGRLLIVGHLENESFLEEMSVAMAKTPRDEALVASIFARHGIEEERASPRPTRESSPRAPASTPGVRSRR